MRIRSLQDFVAGLTLVGVALFALWASAPLGQGRLAAMGPGMMPRGSAILLAVVGALIALQAMFISGERLERWSLRGPFFVCLALVAFAVTIRSMGLIVAGPLVAVISSAASPETRPIEILLFGLGVTIFSIALFKYVLNLPIPVLVIPGVIVL
jgi:hypothetical protein